MQFSVGIEYAMHCLMYLIDVPKGKSLGIKEIATFQGVSESYLSKIFTKLRKADLIRSTTGVKGGYELSKSADDISVWEIVEAIEGSSYFFQCKEIRQQEIILDKDNMPDTHCKGDCLIKMVMVQGEELMRDFYRNKSIGDIYRDYGNKVDEKFLKQVKEYFE